MVFNAQSTIIITPGQNTFCPHTMHAKNICILKLAQVKKRSDPNCNHNKLFIRCSPWPCHHSIHRVFTMAMPSQYSPGVHYGYAITMLTGCSPSPCHHNVHQVFTMAMPSPCSLGAHRGHVITMVTRCSPWPCHHNGHRVLTKVRL